MSKWRRRYMASRAQAEQDRREFRHVAVREDAHIVIGKSFGASVSRGKMGLGLDGRMNFSGCVQFDGNAWGGGALSFPKIISGRIGGATQTRSGWRQ
jgi:hypothetical protein